jgi:3-isopropylmalate/(R)-2-methylmalate dehydratase small subunit
MERFHRLEGVAVPFEQGNIDTDQIVPARFLKKQRRSGFGQYLFHDLRFQADGADKADFILNHAPYRSAQVIVAGPNFGCGSSREAAVWALFDYGFRAVIAPSFGDIFFNNSHKNGLLPIVLPTEVVTNLLACLRAKPGLIVKINLPDQTVTLPDGVMLRFEIDAFAKECMVAGLDELGYTLSRLDEIKRFENAYKAENS